MGLPGWREDLTRYVIIDPIIRALGWDTAEPKECHSEYPLSDDEDRADLSLTCEQLSTPIQATRLPTGQGQGSVCRVHLSAVGRVGNGAARSRTVEWPAHLRERGVRPGRGNAVNRRG